MRIWLRGQDLNLRPSGYEPDELPGCSTPRGLGLSSGLAATYSPASFDAVPSAQRHLTSEFGMGSGVLLAPWPPDRRTTPGRVQGHIILSEFLTDVLGDAICGWRALSHAFTGSDQAYRAISTGQLRALLLLHLRPIDVVVFHGPMGRPCFEGGFPLRCLQRLSCPLMATRHCRWHDNRSTSGAFTPVLSY